MDFGFYLGKLLRSEKYLIVQDKTVYMKKKKIKKKIVV